MKQNSKSTAKQSSGSMPKGMEVKDGRQINNMQQPVTGLYEAACKFKSKK